MDLLKIARARRCAIIRYSTCRLTNCVTRVGLRSVIRAGLKSAIRAAMEGALHGDPSIPESPRIWEVPGGNGGRSTPASRAWRRAIATQSTSAANCPERRSSALPRFDMVECEGGIRPCRSSSARSGVTVFGDRFSFLHTALQVGSQPSAIATRMASDVSLAPLRIGVRRWVIRASRFGPRPSRLAA